MSDTKKYAPEREAILTAVRAFATKRNAPRTFIPDRNLAPLSCKVLGEDEFTQFWWIQLWIAAIGSTP